MLHDAGIDHVTSLYSRGTGLFGGCPSYASSCIGTTGRVIKCLPERAVVGENCLKHRVITYENGMHPGNKKACTYKITLS